MERKKILMEKEKDINRIKVVLVEKKRTNKWLAKQLEKDPATVSKWCTNTSQPSLLLSQRRSHRKVQRQ
jgi:hypothetical protein